MQSMSSVGEQMILMHMSHGTQAPEPRNTIRNTVWFISSFRLSFIRLEQCVRESLPRREGEPQHQPSPLIQEMRKHSHIYLKAHVEERI